MSTPTPYDIIKRLLVDTPLVEALRGNPQITLDQLGITDPGERSNIITIFGLMYSGASQQSAIGQRMREEGVATLDVAREMKEGLKRTLLQIDRAYRSTMLMYQISFYLGVVLILVALGVALIGKDPLLPAIFGALGTADIITFFLLKPQERLQASRASLAQVQAALYNWFMDSVNLNTLMGKFDLKGDLPGAAAVSETLLQHTDKTLEMLQKYCKISEG
jgi:hypothetical protein